MNKAFYITLFLLLLSVSLNVYQYTRPCKVRTESIVTTDSVIRYLKNFDTVFVREVKEIPVHHYHYDTVHIENKVYIRDTSLVYNFREEEYDIDISAVKLDWYKLDIHAKDTVMVTTMNLVQKKDRPISLNVSAGYGVGIKSGKAEPFIGLSVGYRLF